MSGTSPRKYNRTLQDDNNSDTRIWSRTDSSNRTQRKLLNKEGRKALTQHFNISAHSRNYLNAILNIESVSTTINNNKLKLMYRLMNNEITLNIIV